MKKISIKNKFIYLNFIKWLELNQHRFLIQPYIEKINETSFIIAFKNVDYIKVIFKDWGEVEIWATKEDNNDNLEISSPLKEFSDILYDFDIRERKLNKGYLCEVCTPPIYTKDRSSIWEMHVYEPLLKWAVENLIPQNQLCIYETEDKNAHWLKIKNTTELEFDNEVEFRTFCIPLIKKDQSDLK
ncbi:MAG: hypothetical protein H7281_13410 [Bacteriovorax sp.]|nr:hypothetical protein [Bacteriovorax sp.]